MPKDKDKEWVAVVENPELDLKLRVETWLKNTGYPLEYRAANIMRAELFNSYQGYYMPADVEDRNGMEIDLIAAFDPPTPRRSHVWTVCECKTVPSPKVWVAMEHPHADAHNFFEAFGRSAAGDFLEKQDPQFVRKATPPWMLGPIANCIRTMSVSTVPLEDEEKDRTSAHSATAQLVLRTIAVLRDIDDDPSNSGLMPAITVPVLVIQGALATARWEPKTMAFSAQPADVVWVAWGGHRGWAKLEFGFAVVTIDALPKFAKDLRAFAERWTITMDGLIDPHISKISGQDSAGEPRKPPPNPYYRRKAKP